MQYAHMIKITGNDIYNEAQLGIDMSSYCVGTKLEADLRFHKDLFFEEFELNFNSENQTWRVSCSDNVFLDFGDVKKMATKRLNHGDVFSVKYQTSSTELFKIEFSYDFDNGNKDYSRIIDISSANVVIIGSGGDANLKLSGEYLNGGCCELSKRDKTTYNLLIRNQGFGIYHNGKTVVGDDIIKSGDFISVSYYSFYVKDDMIYTSKDVAVFGFNYRDLDTHKQYPKFNRNTRVKSKINSERIDVLDPPQQPQKPSGNIFMQLFPALAMIVLTVVVRGFMGNSSNSSFIIFSVCSMTLGVATSVFSMITERRKYRKDIKERINKYHAYIDKKRNQILQYRTDELTRLNGIFISAENEIENVYNFSGDIFDKTVEDDDFLQVRIGVGKIKAKREIAFKKQEKFESHDELASLPETVYNEFKYIDNAPITIDFMSDSVIGVVGQSSDCYQLTKIISLDIISRHYYKDVQLFFLIDGEDVPRYAEWIRWLPHVFDNISNTRNIVYDSDSRAFVFERLYVEFGRRLLEKNPTPPHYVVFVVNDWGIKTHPVAQFISKAHECNTTFLFFDTRKANLPLWCDKIIFLTEGQSGLLVPSRDKDNEVKFAYPLIHDRQMKDVSKILSPIYCEEISLENTLTRNITLFEMLNILSTDDIDLGSNWDNAHIYDSMAAPIGVKTKNEIVYLDLHEKAHGPHGLVAGTTGSGKSEILQTYILMMAILYHPYEVGFVIIDFKGGGMANQFKTLPHLMGAITNIDGREINRSLMSIKAELEKRQRIFAANNVNNINNYIKLFKSGKASTPVPHLIIVVDEFAELKAEQPEFMKELISTARIGRSLGVHLILATQKPAGQVNEQIWSNSKFKLCLKVQTKEDSNEVLKSPLASEIKEPGRAYLQVGNNEIFELFQSAYSGGPAHSGEMSSENEFLISEVNLQGKRRTIYEKVANHSGDIITTQLDAIVEHVKKYCEQEGIKKLPNICLPPLANVIEYMPVEQDYSNTDALFVPVGIYDNPGNQDQSLAMLNLAAGNTIAIGSSQNGKTNILQLIIRSLAENYSPGDVNIYVFDFGSMALRSFAELHHVGGVVISSEDERVKNFFRLIVKEMGTRKEKLAQLGITSYNSYLEAGNTDLPRIVFIIDNFLAFREMYSDYEDEMLGICRDGIALGISVIVTSSQSNGISYKFMSNFSNRICFFCNSNDEYGAVFDRCRMEPKDVPGRCLIQIEKQVFEAQTFLAFTGEREIDRVEKIRQFILDANSRSSDSYAKEIPSIPKCLDSSYLERQAPAVKPYQPIIGLDYDTVEFEYLDLTHTVTMGISGREGSGKTNFVKLILEYCRSSIFDYPTKAYIVDDYNKQLEQFSTDGFVEKYTIDVNEMDVIFSELEEQLQLRKAMLQSDGPEFLSGEPLLLCVIDNQSIYENDTLEKETVDTYKRIVTSYRALKVLFILSNVPNVNIAYGASEMLKQVKGLNLLFMMDDLANVKLLDLNSATIRQFKKPIEIGDAYRILNDGSVTKMRIIKNNK